MIAAAKGLGTITWGRSTGVEEKEPRMMSWILSRGKEKGLSYLVQLRGEYEAGTGADGVVQSTGCSSVLEMTVR